MIRGGEALAIEEPAEFCARLFWDLLAKRGVVFHGRTRARHPPVSPAHRRSHNLPWWSADTPPVSQTPVVLAEHLSQPLGLDIRVIKR